jgi:hypothetical protein
LYLNLLKKLQLLLLQHNELPFACCIQFVYCSFSPLQMAIPDLKNYQHGAGQQINEPVGFQYLS